MACERFRVGYATSEMAPSRQLVKILAVAIVSMALVSSCSKWEPSAPELVNPALMHRVRSLSLSGPHQAAAIIENTRELKLTNDGGQTWQVIPPSAVDDAFECAAMIDDRRGWAVSHQGYVFTTESGGATWTKISELKDFTCASQIQFANEKEGWIRDCLIIWRTRDGGVTWHKKLSTVTPGVIGQPTGMFVLDGDTLVSSGSGGQVYLTVDGGETWTIQSPLGDDRIDFYDVWFLDRMHGWLTGWQIIVGGELSRPLLLETNDGGYSWKQTSLDTDILPSSVCFVGDDGWLAGSRRIVNGGAIRLEGVLLHTTDGGNRWGRVQLGPDEPFLTEVRFADKDHGWLVGRDTLYRTENGGKTWRPVLSLPLPATH